MGGSNRTWNSVDFRKLREQQAKKKLRAAAEKEPPADGVQLIEEEEEESCSDSHGNIWTIYKDVKGEWRWQCSAKDGGKPSTSGKGYKNKHDCIEAARQESMDCEPS